MLKQTMFALQRYIIFSSSLTVQVWERMLKLRFKAVRACKMHHTELCSRKQNVPHGESFYRLLLYTLEGLLFQ